MNARRTPCKPHALRPSDRDALVVIRSFYMDETGVRVEDVADELSVTRETAARRVSRLRSAGLVYTAGPRPRAPYRTIRPARADDRLVWRDVCEPRDEGVRLTVAGLMSATGLTVHRVEAALDRLRKRGAVSASLALWPTALGIWLVDHPTGETSPGVMALRVRRNPMLYRAAGRVELLIALAVAREVDATGGVVTAELAGRLQLTALEVEDVIRDMVRSRFLEARTP